MPTCVSNVSCIYHTLLIDVSKFDGIQSNNQVCILRQKTCFFFLVVWEKNVVTSRDILLPLDIPECTSVKQLLACTQAQVGACLIGFSMSEEFTHTVWGII